MLATGIVMENKLGNEGKHDYRPRLDENVLENMEEDDPRFHSVFLRCILPNLPMLSKELLPST